MITKLGRKASENSKDVNFSDIGSTEWAKFHQFLRESRICHSEEYFICHTHTAPQCTVFPFETEADKSQ